uniref:Peptidase A1 domain-containing protein n=1 Tax=Leersia perrieri TaxID=77586 RepID=A0A0D9XZ93_9ORYZ
MLVAASLLGCLGMVSSATRPPAGPKLSGFVAVARPWLQRTITGFLKDLLQQEAYDAIVNTASAAVAGVEQQQLGGAAATSTAALLVINMSIGTPTPQNVSALVHITSQLVWAQCSPPANTFRQDNSSTFSPLPCASPMCPSALRRSCGGAGRCDAYTARYGPGVNTTGHLATDTFTFGSTRVPGIVFGCSDGGTNGDDFSGASGVIGLGRGPLSLISQLQLSRFSYQLWAPNKKKSSKSSGDVDGSIIRLGDEAVPKTKNSRSTPLLSSRIHPNLYYVNLTGILVDGDNITSAVAAALGLKANGSGGVVLSTTIPVTYLEVSVYRVVRKAVASRMTSLQPVNGSALGLDLCYAAAAMEKVKVPRLTLAFDGGAEMELAVANYFLRDEDTGLECLTMLPTHGVSVLGSLLQAGINMIFDVDGERLTFEVDASSRTTPWTIIVACVIAALAQAARRHGLGLAVTAHNATVEAGSAPGTGGGLGALTRVAAVHGGLRLWQWAAAACGGLQHLCEECVQMKLAGTIATMELQFQHQIQLLASANDNRSSKAVR